MEPHNQTEFTKFKPRMPPNNPNQLNTKRTILISLSFFTVLMAWSYFNFKVPLLLEEILQDMESITAKQTIKGVILALDNLIAVIVQPFFGNLSDRTCSKYGRRMPYIIMGTILSALFFVVIPFMQVLIALVLIIFLFDFSMAIYRSVSIAILPDYTPDQFRSKASAIQQFISNMGGVLAFIIPSIIKVIPNLSDLMTDALGFIIVSSAMILVVLVQIIVIKETPTGDGILQLHSREIEINPMNFYVREKQNAQGECEDAIPIGQQIKEVFISPEKSFRNILFVVLFAYTGFAAVEAFFSTFVQYYMGKAENVSSTLFLAYSGPMIITAYFWGLLGQKIGRRKAAKVGLLGVILSSFIMVVFLVPNIYNPLPVENLEENFTNTDILVMVNLAFISMPWMCFIVNSFPIVWALAPEGKVGSYTGVYYTFNQFAYSIAPIIFGINLDFFQNLGPRKYIVLFPLVLICMIIAFLFMLGVKQGDKKLSEEDIKEYEEKYMQND